MMDGTIVMVQFVGGMIAVGRLKVHPGTPDSDAHIICGVLEKPAEVFVAPTPEGMQVNLVPFGTFFGLLRDGVDYVEINPAKLIVQPRPAPEQMIQQWTKATSGLVLASSMP